MHRCTAAMNTKTHIRSATLTLRVTTTRKERHLHVIFNTALGNALPEDTPTPLLIHSSTLGTVPRPLVLPIIGSNELSVTPQLNRRDYRRGETVFLRLMVTNRSRVLIGISTIPAGLANVAILDPNGRQLPYNSRLLRRTVYKRIPGVAIKPGARFITSWIPLSEWGFAPSRAGRYLLTVTPSARPVNAYVRNSGYARMSSPQDKVSFVFLIR